MNEGQPVKVPVIGIVGGIGSGKSSVVRGVSGLRLLIINADGIGHELLLDQTVQSEIRISFGDEVFSPSGSVDRGQLASRVFGATPKHKALLKTLNEILHPRIRKVIRQQIDSASAQYDAVILDAALLLESGWDKECHSLIFIDTILAERVRRVTRDRNWSEEELLRREATQLPLVEKRGRADYIVDNSGSPEASAEQMERILRSILAQQSAASHSDSVSS